MKKNLEMEKKIAEASLEKAPRFIKITMDIATRAGQAFDASQCKDPLGGWNYDKARAYQETLKPLLLCTTAQQEALKKLLAAAGCEYTEEMNNYTVGEMSIMIENAIEELNNIKRSATPKQKALLQKMTLCPDCYISPEDIDELTAQDASDLIQKYETKYTAWLKTRCTVETRAKIRAIMRRIGDTYDEDIIIQMDEPLARRYYDQLCYECEHPETWRGSTYKLNRGKASENIVAEKEATDFTKHGRVTDRELTPCERDILNVWGTEDIRHPKEERDELEAVINVLYARVGETADPAEVDEMNFEKLADLVQRVREQLKESISTYGKEKWKIKKDLKQVDEWTKGVLYRLIGDGTGDTLTEDEIEYMMA